MIRFARLKLRDIMPQDWIVIGVREGREPPMAFIHISFPWKVKRYSAYMDCVEWAHPYWHLQWFVAKDFGNRKLKVPQESDSKCV